MESPDVVSGPGDRQHRRDSSLNSVQPNGVTNVCVTWYSRTRSEGESVAPAGRIESKLSVYWRAGNTSLGLGDVARSTGVRVTFSVKLDWLPVCMSRPSEFVGCPGIPHDRMRVHEVLPDTAVWKIRRP